MECNRCGEQKQAGVKKIMKGGVQIGKAAAEKSRGLFSADDWICKTYALLCIALVSYLLASVLGKLLVFYS